MHLRFFSLDDGQLRLDAGDGVGIHTELEHALSNSLGNQRGIEVGIGAQQGVGAGVRLRPFTAVTGHVIELTQHIGSHIRTPVVELFFELVFNDLALFFDHQNFLQSCGELACKLRVQRPHHGDFVQANAQTAASVIVQTQVKQGLACVVEGFAAGDQPQAVALAPVGALDHVVIQTVGAHIGQRGIPLVVKQAGLLFERGIGPSDVNTTHRHLKLRHDDVHAVWVNHSGRAGLHNFLNRLHP